MTNEPIIVGTYTGYIMDLQRMKSSDVRLADIAHQLALTCRFAGQVNSFYSVAEHSVRLSNLSDIFPHPAEILMHDAAETYIGDLSPGLKRAFNIRPFEEKLQDVIARHFGLQAKWMRHPDLKKIEEIMARTEIRDLINWKQSQAYYLKVNLGNEPLADPIEPWTWEQAEITFLARAAGLGIKD